MAQHLAQSLAPAQLGPDAAGPPALALVQAGTGVGKSAAYLAVGVALALARGVRLVVSTATVALQEQLLHKDLPALSAVLDAPLKVALAKGRTRYVCAVKLAQWADAAGGAAAATLELALDSDEANAATPPALQRHGSAHAHWYASWLKGEWDGDRDSLSEPPEPAAWAPVAADRHTCSGRQCPQYRACSYTRARLGLAQAQVIVANHDLVLASIGRGALPELNACLWVFDEAHHLPAVALAQFAAQLDLTALAWLDKLPRTLLEVAERASHPLPLDPAELANALRQAQQSLARLVLADWVDRPIEGDWRLPRGLVPAHWRVALDELRSAARHLLDELQALAECVRQRARDDMGDAPLWSAQYARLGVFAPRLIACVQAAQAWLEEADPPLARWLSVGVRAHQLSLTLHASPLHAAATLRSQLWPQVRAAALTSATLTACGQWTHFLTETGLIDQPGVAPRVVASPFDYARQARLVVVHTRADPSDASAYWPEVLAALLHDLSEVRAGALVLFTSRAQLAAAQRLLQESAWADLRAAVGVQGSASRTRLLAQHRNRVAAGQPAILWGLQSFGEGLDLPGALCEDLFITKLPFASPTDPVEQARAEWMRACGQDPFGQWVVPATAQRLMQWTGRAIRSETDRAQVVCYDRRLIRTGWGRRLLAGLPPYPVWQRDVAGGTLTQLSDL